MTKKTYIQPSFTIFRLQHRQHILGISDVNSKSSSNDVDLKYDKSGGDPNNAW